MEVPVIPSVQRPTSNKYFVPKTCAGLVFSCIYLYDIETWSQHGRKCTGLKFQLSTYKYPTGRTLPCYSLTKT